MLRGKKAKTSSWKRILLFFAWFCKTLYCKIENVESIRHSVFEGLGMDGIQLILILLDVALKTRGKDGIHEYNMMVVQAEKNITKDRNNVIL